MKTIKIKAFKFFLFLLILAISGCSKDDAPEPIVESIPEEKIELSSEKQITSFVFLLTNNPLDVNVIATIDEENKTIVATMPAGTIVSGLIPEVQLSELSSTDRTAAQDFTEPVAYTVTAENGSEVIYTVTINTLLTQRQILQAILDANPNNTIDWDLNATENLNDLEGVTLNTEDEIIELDINVENISTLPPEIGQLTNLTKLFLAFNQLTFIPPEIELLTNLTNLNLGANQLTSIPPGIWQLTNLTHLTLRDNQLTFIPPEIELLTNLTNLNLGRNQLTAIPPEIWQLTNLEFLVLDDNQLTSVPPEIGQLTNLEDLDLNSNQLISLPPEIGQLTNLEKFILSNNQLTSLPPEIGFLSNLKILNFRINNISAIPIAIIFLAVHGTSGLTISNDIGAIATITSKNDAFISIYSANPDNTLDWGVANFPGVEFNGNGNPVSITMNNKNLTRIPNAIGELTALEILNINSNALESLPNTLGDLNSLNVITAASNELNTVPSELGQLFNLALLSLTNNPLESIPQEVCELQTSNGGILTIQTDPGEACN